MKAAERYLKRLEFLLSQVEDLSDQYSLNQRLRDGVSVLFSSFNLIMTLSNWLYRYVLWLMRMHYPLEKKRTRL